MTIANAAAARQQYARDAILSASPARLLTMLYDRLLLDLRRAETAQEASDWASANTQLLHAQEIIAELSATLRPDVWDGAEGLLALYEYVRMALVGANIHRDVARTREAISLLTPLHEAWHSAAGAVTAPAPGAASTPGAVGAAGAAGAFGAAGAAGAMSALAATGGHRPVHAVG